MDEGAEVGVMPRGAGHLQQPLQGEAAGAFGVALGVGGGEDEVLVDQAPVRAGAAHQGELFGMAQVRMRIGGQHMGGGQFAGGGAPVVGQGGAQPGFGLQRGNRFLG